jgi:hypothetical protein
MWSGRRTLTHLNETELEPKVDVFVLRGIDDSSTGFEAL